MEHDYISPFPSSILRGTGAEISNMETRLGAHMLFVDSAKVLNCSSFTACLGTKRQKSSSRKLNMSTQDIGFHRHGVDTATIFSKDRGVRLLDSSLVPTTAA